jgi:nitrous oxidase accessory protein NosD
LTIDIALYILVSMKNQVNLPIIILTLCIYNFSCGAGSSKSDAFTGDTIQEIITCTEGEKKCGEDGKSVLTCSPETGGWISHSTCPETSECKDGECTCAIWVNNEWHPVGVQTCAEGWKKTGDCGCEPILDECKENEIPLFGGGCQKVGPECEEGWKEMEGGGCEPILDDCPEGTIQKIGGGCEKIGPQDECGEGKWGNIPKEVTSGKILYVWAGYTGTDSDGSQEKPFTKIQDGINAAKAGDTVAIGANVAEGLSLPYEEYSEGIVISKPINLRGRCSKMVKVTGETNTAVTGLTATLYIIGSKNIRISELWVSGSGSGLVINKGEGHELKNVTSSGNKGHGIVIISANNISINNCTISENVSGQGHNLGQGIHIESNSAATIKSCSVVGNTNLGIFVDSSEVAIESTIIKDTKPDLNVESGWGIEIVEKSSATIKSCSVVETTGIGIFVHSSVATIESSIIKDTKPDINVGSGLGIMIYENSTATIRSCSIVGNTDSGIAVLSSSITIESSIVKETKPDINGEFGRGIAFGDKSTATIKSCSVVENTSIGIFVDSSATTIESSLVKDTKPDYYGFWGDGIFIQGNDSHIIINDCKIYNNHASGIDILGSRGEIRNSHIINIVKSKGKWVTDDGMIVDVTDLGDGIEIINSSGGVTVDSNIIELCERAGVIFDNSKGSFTNNIISKSQFGYVSQSSSEVEESGNMFGDNEVDKNINPEEPLLVDNVEKKIPDIEKLTE